MMRYILASGSPRRGELLKKLRIPFTICPADCDEVVRGTPGEAVRGIAEDKARHVAGIASSDDAAGDLVVLGADTAVVCDGVMLGKPRDRAHMERMMRSLAGRAHEVYTGVAIVFYEGAKERCHSFAERTKVTFYPMDDDEIRSYAELSDGLDKAGGYGIQSDAAIYIKGIEGDYNNVVGLPVARLYHEMKALGLI